MIRRSLRKLSLPRRAVVSLLSVVLVASVAICFYTVYFGSLVLSLGGLGGLTFSSATLVRPAFVMLLAWLAWRRCGLSLPANKEVTVLLICWVAYSFAFFTPPSQDVLPTEYTALSIAVGAGTSLAGYTELTEDGVPYFARQTRVGLRSGFPIGPALLAWPMYLPAFASDIPRPELVDRLGQFSAILIALAGVWLAMRIAARLDPPFSPHLVGLVYGLGTSHWAISASALWQHGPGELWVLGALDRMTDESAPAARRFLAMGACLSLAVFTRPVLAGPAVLIAAAALWRFRGRCVSALVGAVSLGLPLALYNLFTYGSLAGPYGGHLRHVLAAPLEIYFGRLYWLIASPSRGVLWFEPVVVFTLVLAALKLRRTPNRGNLLLGMGGFLILWITYSKWAVWWGGHGFGPRYMTDALPMWLLVVVSLGPIKLWNKAAMMVFASAGAAITLAFYAGTDLQWSNGPSVDWFPERTRSLGDSQLLAVVLAVSPESNVSRAQRFQSRGDSDRAIDMWRQESWEHPWNGFAAVRWMDSLVRAGKLREARRQVVRFRNDGSEDAYFRHLDRRLPSIIEILESRRWRTPSAAMASRNDLQSGWVHDGLLETQWSTRTPQKRSDWLELATDPTLAVRGVTLLSIPDFGHGPAAIELQGRDAAGERVYLGRHDTVTAPRKGWITMRFPACRLAGIRIRLLRDSDAPWTVAEARWLVAEEED